MKQIDLNGTWQMHLPEGGQLDCTVPGSVAACLLQHGRIEDPYVMDNEKKVLPVFEQDYTFARSFSVTAEDLAHDKVLLHCDGLDTIATLMLNSTEIGRAENMHRTYVYDVKPLLRPGENTLSVLFASPLQYLKDHPSQTGKRFSTIRKAACMFGWDWGIELPDSGIWRDIYIEAFDVARIEHVACHQTHQNGQVQLDVSVELELFGADAAVALQVLSPSGEVAFSGERPANQSGKTKFSIEVQNPQLWWPVGYGAQPLYTLCAEVKANGKTVDESKKQIGLRTLVLDRSKREGGSNYGFVVNGKPIFFRGENLIIEDAVISRTTPQHWQKLIDNCLRSNLNGIRVWGGAYYPPDVFYELCDKHGLMVYQDFMFACTFYATPDDFMQNAEQEVRDNLKRMAHHPSLALLCGNNEIDCIYTTMTSDEAETAALRKLFGGNKKFSWLIKTVVWKMYKKLFLKLIPSLCEELVPDVNYVHSSPSVRKPGKATSFFDYLSDGDMHYYLQYNDNAPYQRLSTIRVRFMTEMGFQSYPSMKTINTFADKASQNPYSPIMYAHQKCNNGNEAIELYMERDYGVPKDFAHYVYLSQLQAGEIMKYSIEHMRRDNTYSRGMVIWQLNDCWPVVSWSGIDYFGRWKAQQYYTKRFFAPVLVSAQVAEGSAIAELWVSNESIETVNGTLRWKLRTAGSEILAQGEAPVAVAAGISQQVETLDCQNLAAEHSLNSVYLEYELANGSEILGQGITLFVLAKEFMFQQPKIQAQVREEKDAYIIELHAGCFAKGVALDTAVGDCLFSDNFFDVSAGDARQVTVQKQDIEGISSVVELQKNLTTTCLNEVMLGMQG